MAGVLRLSAVVAACVLLAGAVAVSASKQKVITVGGEGRGWTQPAPGDETYNHWAGRNRFHVGDLLYFRYAKNDSVLVVTRDDYKLCRGDRPALRLDGGEEARFRLERSGVLYFISGAPGHCDAGQRLTVRVMAQHGAGGDGDASSPSQLPALSPGGSGSSTTPVSGGSKTPPRGKAGDGKSTSGATASLFGGYHAVGVALCAAMLLLP